MNHALTLIRQAQRKFADVLHYDGFPATLPFHRLGVRLGSVRKWYDGLPANVAKENSMKSRRSFLVLALAAFGLLSPAVTHASCTASTISGTYGFAVQGFNMKPGDPVAKSVAYALIGTITFNADGTVNRTFTLNAAGQIASDTNSGTSTENPDCSGSIAFNAPFGLETFSFTIVGKGAAILFLNTTTALFPNVGFVQSGRMEKQ